MLNKLLIAFLLCGSLCVSPNPALAQVGFPRGFNIGPSKAAIIGAIVGAAVVIGIVVYVVIPKQKTIEGCVLSEENGLRLTNSKGDRTYILQTSKIELQPGRRLALKGKKAKGKSGAHEFSVRKLVKDEGACTEPPPGAAPGPS